eukprot:COSAG02_NODE_1651_length_11496_cov_9.620460_6_plen_308_part_00
MTITRWFLTGQSAPRQNLPTGSVWSAVCVVSNAYLQRPVTIAPITNGMRARTIRPTIQVIVPNPPDVRHLASPLLLPATTTTGHIECNLTPSCIKGRRHLGILLLALEAGHRGAAPIHLHEVHRPVCILLRVLSIVPQRAQVARAVAVFLARVAGLVSSACVHAETEASCVGALHYGREASGEELQRGKEFIRARVAAHGEAARPVARQGVMSEQFIGSTVCSISIARSQRAPELTSRLVSRTSSQPFSCHLFPLLRSFPVPAPHCRRRCHTGRRSTKNSSLSTAARQHGSLARMSLSPAAAATMTP